MDVKEPGQAEIEAAARALEAGRLVALPPETASGMCGARFKIIVSGPGQKASASWRASDGISVTQ